MDKPCFWHHFSITHRVYFVLQFRKKKERKKIIWPYIKQHTANKHICNRPESVED